MKSFISWTRWHLWWLACSLERKCGWAYLDPNHRTMLKTSFFPKIKRIAKKVQRVEVEETHTQRVRIYLKFAFSVHNLFIDVFLRIFGYWWWKIRYAHMNEMRVWKMPTCHVCGRVFPEDEGYYCSDCREFTCNSAWCGDGDRCSSCLGDELFLLDIFE